MFVIALFIEFFVALNYYKSVEQSRFYEEIVRIIEQIEKKKTERDKCSRKVRYARKMTADRE